MRKAYLSHSSCTGALCTLCEKLCRLRDGEVGPCDVRQCVDGSIYTRADGALSSIARGSVESQGFYHVLPGTEALLTSPGGSLRADVGLQDLVGGGRSGQSVIQCTAGRLPMIAEQAGCESIVFGGGVEPTFYLETVIQALSLAAERGIVGMIQTNGAMTSEALDVLAPFVRAASVQVPTMLESTASRMGSTMPHLLRQTIRGMRERGIWVEVSTVIEPGLGESEQELTEIALSLGAIDAEIPWHLSHSAAAPPFLDSQIEPQEAVGRAAEIGFGVGLQHVYAPGAPSLDFEVTLCPGCGGGPVMERFHGQRGTVFRTGGDCPHCGHQVGGVFGAAEIGRKAAGGSRT